MTPGNIVEWPDLSAYPAWINTVAGVIFAAGIAIVTLTAFFGRLRGALTPAADRDNTAQLAMVALDSTAIREHTKAVTLVGEQLVQLNTIGERYLTALEERQEEADKRAERQAGFEEGQRATRARARARAPKKPGGPNMNLMERP